MPDRLIHAPLLRLAVSSMLEDYTLGRGVTEGFVSLALLVVMNEECKRTNYLRINQCQR
jgi:hypothetical protein